MFTTNTSSYNFFNKITQLINNCLLLFVDNIRDTFGNITLLSLLSIIFDIGIKDNLVISSNYAVNWNRVFNQINSNLLKIMVEVHTIFFNYQSKCLKYREQGCL